MGVGAGEGETATAYRDVIANGTTGSAASCIQFIDVHRLSLVITRALSGCSG